MIYKPKILVVSPDKEIRKLLFQTLKESDYNIYQTDLQYDFPRLDKTEYDAAILDLDGQDVAGIQAVKTIRKHGQCPLMVLCPGDDSDFRIKILNAGADECMQKPFAPEELLAELRALFRRMPYSAACQEGQFQGTALKISFEDKQVLVNGKPVDLSPREYALLCLMAKNAGCFLSKEYIIDKLWKHSSSPSKSLQVCMSQLRKKLAAVSGGIPLVETQIKSGYILVDKICN